jgi:DNA polymerase II small subunit
MSTNKILLKFAKKGINLSPEAYNTVINAENPLDFASSLIVKLKSDRFSSKDLVSVSGETINELLGNNTKTDNTNQKTLTNENSVDKSPEVKPEIKKPIKQTPQIEKPKKEIKKPVETKPAIEKPKEETKAVKPTSIDNLKKDSDKPEKYVNKAIVEATETVKDEKIKFKRNEQKINATYDFKIIQDMSKKSYTSGELENLIAYFKNI